jgi:hypothetical protein
MALDCSHIFSMVVGGKWIYATAGAAMIAVTNTTPVTLRR